MQVLSLFVAQDRKDGAVFGLQLLLKEVSHGFIRLLPLCKLDAVERRELVSRQQSGALRGRTRYYRDHLKAFTQTVNFGSRCQETF